MQYSQEENNPSLEEILDKKLDESIWRDSLEDRIGW